MGVAVAPGPGVCAGVAVGLDVAVGLAVGAGVAVGMGDAVGTGVGVGTSGGRIVAAMGWLPPSGVLQFSCSKANALNSSAPVLLGVIVIENWTDCETPRRAAEFVARISTPPPMVFAVQPVAGETIAEESRWTEFGTFTRTQPMNVAGRGGLRFLAVKVTVFAWPA